MKNRIKMSITSMTIATMLFSLIPLRVQANTVANIPDEQLEEIGITEGYLEKDNYIENEDAPEILNVSISKESYKLGEEVEVTVIISKEVEQLSVVFDGRTDFERDYSEHMLIENFVKNKDGNYVGIWRGEMSNQVVTARYHLIDAFVGVYDGNQIELDTTELSAEFITTDSPELNRPELISVTFDKDYYSPNQEGKITVIASDDSGIESFSAYIYVGDGWEATIDLEVLIENFTKIGPELYLGEGTYKSPDYTESFFNESISVPVIRLYDLHGNGDIIWGQENTSKYLNFGESKPHQKELSDPKTNISVLTDSQESLILEVLEAEASINVPKVLGNDYLLYDISLVKIDGESFDLDGMVTVRIPYDSKTPPLNIYHFGSNFEIEEKLKFTDHGDYVEFKTDHFSYFGIEFGESDDTDDTEELVTDDIANTPDNNVIDNTASKPDSNETNDTVNNKTDSNLTNESETEIEANKNVNSQDKIVEELPGTGVASTFATTALGLLFTTVGALIGFKKRD